MNDALWGAMGQIDRLKLMTPSLDLAQETFGKAAMLGDLAAEAVRKASMIGSETSRTILAHSQYLNELSEHFKTLYRPPILNVTQYDWSGILSRNLLGHQELLQEYQREIRQRAMQVSTALTEFHTSWSRIAERNQAMIASMQASIASNRELLAPFLQAESAWIRTAQFPATSTDWKYIADTARDLASHIADSWAAAAARQTAAPTDQEEHALRVAEERFSEILAEKNPRIVLHALRAFFDQVVAKLPHFLGKTLHLFLIHLLVTLVYDTAIGPKLHHEEKHPTIVKEIRTEAKRGQRTQVVIPSDVRVVIASQLFVHQGPSRRARQVGRLYAGDIVYVEKVKTRSWSLVELVDYESVDGDSVIRGWVFTRYIKRLSGGRRLP